MNSDMDNIVEYHIELSIISQTGQKSWVHAQNCGSFYYL